MTAAPQPERFAAVDAGAAGTPEAMAEGSDVVRLRWPGRLWLLPVVPAVASLLSARAQGWVPVADAAVAAVRAADVARGHLPRLGMPASVSEFAPGPMRYHPGPLLFWALAPFVWAFGAQAGAAVGAVAINTVASMGTIRATARAGRPRLVVLATITTIFLGIVVWGPGHLYDPFNTMLPAVTLFTVFVLAWRLADGDGDLLPWAVVAASFCIQVHVVYAIPILATLGPAVVVAIGPERLRRSGASRPSSRRIAVAAGLGILLWSGPIYDAVVHRGGNLLVLTHGTEGAATIGIAGVVASVAQLVAIPPIAFLALSDDAFFRGPGVLGIPVAAIAGYLGWLGIIRGSATVRRLLAVAALAVVGAGANVALLPDEPVKSGQLTFYKVVFAFVWFALIGGWLDRAVLPERRARVVRRIGLAIAIVVTIEACIPFQVRNGTDADSWLYDATPALTSDLERALDPDQTYRIEAAGGSRYLLLMYGLIAGLDARGRSIGVTPERATNYGEDRVLSAKQAITLVVQPPEVAPPEGGRLIASFRPQVDADERAALEEELLRRAREHGTVRLTSNGRNQLAATLLGRPGIDEREVERIRADPSRLLELPAANLAALYRNDWVIEPSLPSDLRDDYVRLLGPSSVDVWEVPRR